MEQHLPEIIENIQYGMDCMVNVDTLEIEFCSNGMEEFDDHKEFGQTLNYKKWTNFIKIDALTLHEKFHIMDLYATQLKNKRMKERLFYALDNENPIGYFRKVIKGTDFFKEWTDFNNKEILNILKSKHIF